MVARSRSLPARREAARSSHEARLAAPGALAGWRREHAKWARGAYRTTRKGKKALRRWRRHEAAARLA